MSSRLDFVKKHLIIQHTQKVQKQNGIFIVSINKVQIPASPTMEDHTSGSSFLAKSLKQALQKIKLAPQAIQVIVMGSSILSTGQMPALTDKFSTLFGTSFGTYIMNNSSGLKPLFQSINQIKFNKRGIVALGSLQKVRDKSIHNWKNDSIQLKEINKQQQKDSKSLSADERQQSKLWKLTEQEKLQFIKDLSSKKNQFSSKSQQQQQQAEYNFDELPINSDSNDLIKRGGACSLILMSGQRISRCENILPLAKVLAYSESPLNIQNIFLSLFSSITICLERARLTIQEIDYFEFREAYPIIPITLARMFKIDHKKINVHHDRMTIGGPSKVNGASVVENLIFLMKNKNGRFGLAGICNENGSSTSIIIANVPMANK